MTSLAEPTTHTLDVPGAVLTYDVRSNGASSEPNLVLIGLPMGAGAFNTLASHFPDRTVVTYDPRGADRSARTDGGGQTTPEQHADDVHRIIADLGGRPVDLFGSSGGAVVGLELVAHHPEDVRILVAHEPPNFTLLPDRKQALAVVEDIYDTYLRSGWGHAMAKFIASVSVRGPIPADYLAQPAPDPQMFGLPGEDNGARDDALFGQTIMGTTHHQLDFDALCAASTRIVMAAGEESDGVLPSRAAYAIAERLGSEPQIFPSDHGGFMGGEYGQKGMPEEFAAKLREVLSGPA